MVHFIQSTINPRREPGTIETMKPGLAHRTLSSAIAEQLRQAILAGRYPAGHALRQDALAAEFAVSRIPVREALFQLEAEGLVRIEPHRGALVAGFAADEIDDVFDLRVLLEPRLLARSAPRLTEADHAEIGGLDAAFAEAIAREDVARWGELNARFHSSLYRHAALPRTAAIVAALLQASDRYTRVQLTREAALARAQREHRKLAALCRQGRTEEACEHLVAHIEAVRRDLHRLIPAAAPPRARQPAKPAPARARRTP
jgi:DNA-binding GntR family transcriptional regulator